MKEFINGFGTAMVKLNQIVPGHEHAGNIYKPGIGPYGEDNIVDMAMEYLTNNNLVNEDYIIRPNMDQKVSLGLQNYKGIIPKRASAIPISLIGIIKKALTVLINYLFFKTIIYKEIIFVIFPK